jgi:hypothetical protein
MKSSPSQAFISRHRLPRALKLLCGGAADGTAVFEKSVACDQILLRGVFLNLVKTFFNFI